MAARPNVPQPADAKAFRAAIGAALIDTALPGETDKFGKAAREAAAEFVAQTAFVRKGETPAIALESIGAEEEGGFRRMRLAVVNKDKPFLVDSISGAIALFGLAVERLLHPVVAVARDKDGTLLAIGEDAGEGATFESLIYLETERADAKDRRALITAIGQTLADVRAAVRDWPKMQAMLRADAEALGDSEGGALLHWFLDGHLTQLGHERFSADGERLSELGVPREHVEPTLSPESRALALDWFRAGNPPPLMLKASVNSTVHRRAPLDLILVPLTEGEQVTGVSIHSGLWTSKALAANSADVPVLRAGLARIQRKYGFNPSGHAGKALAHALSELPHDLVIGFAPKVMEAVALTAMSVADRPRPALLLAPGALGRHLHALIWMPQDELSTARRNALGAMIERETGATILSWALELEEGDAALLRFTLDMRECGALPDTAKLNEQLTKMVRGWNPGVESALRELGEGQRAARLALRYANSFPASFRDAFGAQEAAEDIARLSRLADERQRGARLFRRANDEGRVLRLKLYHQGGLIALSEAVPALENFGFRVLAEVPTQLDHGRLGHIHDYLLDFVGDAAALLERAETIESAVAAVIEGRAEDDAFNQLIGVGGLAPRAAVLFRAWFRYLRQTGLAYGLDTVAAALRRAPAIAGLIIDLFDALHAPTADDARAAEIERDIDEALAGVTAIDDDRLLRRFRAIVQATLRTNAFAPGGEEALAFKLDSAAVPGLPAPRPWREIWVYSPRVEGIHLRGGPVARGGLRWSDRRDDFRTEILGLMKAQLVKNAVIVPTGAKGGFYPKHLPSPAADREAWLKEGTESYRVFIRALLSVTDNIVEDRIEHPRLVRRRDGDDPYFVVAADKGTATFSDIANAISLEQGFWLGDAFASGGSQGYDHKAMGITARGAWVSVQRHFAERGVDVQTQPVTVAGCGDMSGDVFGNGMLLSKTLRLVAAFDHRHFFFDPDPDPAASWAERDRMFKLPRSSWADYDSKLISRGGGIYPRSSKQIPISREMQAVLGVSDATLDPSGVIAAILKAPVDLLWFGGIGTYIKAESESNAEVGDPGNDAHRINGEQVRAIAIGEGANLGVTQAGRIEFSAKGGRINTDFIDNSAGVDCSDNEVNIKIPLNREMAEGRLTFEARNKLLASMTDEVAALVLEDNRLQTLAISLAERGGAGALPGQVRVIEIMEASGRIDRAVEGLESSDDLLRRAQDERGLTRPELAVILSHGKIAIQDAIEKTALAEDPALTPVLRESFPSKMRRQFVAAIDAHRLRGPIIATEMANRLVNRLGIVAPFELAEEEGAPLSQVAMAYFACDLMFDLEELWRDIEKAGMGEEARLALLDLAASAMRLHLADVIRVSAPDAMPGAVAERLGPGVARLDKAAQKLLKAEAKGRASVIRARLEALQTPAKLTDRVVRLDELDGAIGIAALAADKGFDEVEATSAYVRLGETLGLDWAKAAALRCYTSDPWEKLLTAGLARDFEQLRLDFLARGESAEPSVTVESWLDAQTPRIAQFKALTDRARAAAAPSPAMLAQVANQARVLLGR